MDALSVIDALNRRFGIPGIAEVIAGKGGLPKLRVTAPAGSAEIYLHGAQVTSFKPAGAEEALFLSEHSHWADGRAIRGGIPICFPWFRAKAGDPKAPSHGFVRTRQWELGAVRGHEDGAVTVVLSTGSDEATRHWWPHEFRIEHRVTVGKALRLELAVTNAGTSAFQFEEALHTYFLVGEAQQARVRGLDGSRFLNNTAGNRAAVQSGDVAFSAATDNAYLETQAAPELIDPVLGRTLRTDKENSATTIVWNPWKEGAASLADLGDGEWRRMACVEASNILGAAVALEPGKVHTMRATLSVASNPEVTANPR